MKQFKVVLNIPSPYRIHLLSAMSRQVQQRGFNFCAHFMAQGHQERPRAWLNPCIPFNHKYHKDYGFKAHHFNPGLIFSLMCKRVDVLIVGSPFDTFTGICAALLLRAKAKICWVEGNTKTPGKIGGFIGWFKRLILSKFDYVAVPGQDGANYIELYRKSTRKKLPAIVLLPNLIDETRFKPRNEWELGKILECRKVMRAREGDKICLIPARLTSVKGLIPFIEALDAKWLEGWQIVIMGQGELRNDILRNAEKKKILDHLLILDYVPYEDMPAFYAASDLLLLPSIYDPNPLSVPEALHSGLPVALSNQLGNVEEGVTDGKNGWVLPVLNKYAFNLKLKEVFASSEAELVKKGCMSKFENASFWLTKRAICEFVDTVVPRE